MERESGRGNRFSLRGKCQGRGPLSNATHKHHGKYVRRQKQNKPFQNIIFTQ